MGIFLAWGLCNYRASGGCGVTMGGGGGVDRGGWGICLTGVPHHCTHNCYTNMKTGIFPHTNGIVKASQSKVIFLFKNYTGV